MASKHLPPAPHSAEPWDGTDRDMHACIECQAYRGACTHRRWQATYVTALRATPQRCPGFRRKK